MPVNLLAINVGNSRIHAGVFASGKLLEHRHLDHGNPAQVRKVLKELFAPIQGAEDEAVYVASVNDPAAVALEEIAAHTLGVETQRVERDVPIPLGRQLDPETIPGVDRLLNAAAAFDRLKSVCVVVDAGTAVTVDFVDGAGVFHGGAILPGAAMMLAALHERTAQLPKVPFARPEEPIGHNTAQAMLSGVFHGLRGAVRELVEAYATGYGAWPKVIATGGDGQLLFEGYDVVEALVPELGLLGMAVTRHYALEHERDGE